MATNSSEDKGSTGRGYYAHAYVTPTSMLAALLRPAIERENDIPNGIDQEPVGGIEKIIRGMPPVLTQRTTGKKRPLQPQSVPRRIWSILHEETKATNIELADALLLGAGIRIEETDLPTLPGGIVAAKEMVQVRADLKGIDLTPEQVTQFGKELVQWTKGFMDDPCPDKWEDAPEWFGK